MELTAEENRMGRLLELLAENQMEEADQMFRTSHPEYQRQAEIESEAQKVFYGLQAAEEMKTARFAVKGVAAAIKAAVSSTKALTALAAAGGGLAVFLILVVGVI